MISRRNSNLSEERVGFLGNGANDTLELHRQFSVAKWIGGILSSLDGWPNWRALMVRFAWFLVPSFLQGVHIREQIYPAKLGPTAYLDGSSAVAIFFVISGYALSYKPIQHTRSRKVGDFSNGLSSTAFRRGAVPVFLVSICIADIFWRAVDIPVVKFARWFENKLIVKVD
ncbi:hypothetical protein G7Z17_g5825 [Cylindrodendrum hubeiense]|uniref:Uncharacterized protein n=1 Tax=Cylindrodendrum hubeiense TaxID=595255 RepID=A0A9P5HB51_9HYPO|nr:hypothetical protein G7Z17_g5825 [Cylindrodendrum hubeiense]